MSEDTLAQLARLAADARTAKSALRDAVYLARRSGFTEADVVRATGLARATVRAWTASREKKR